MARTANPNKEKITELKSALKDHTKSLRTAESAAKKAAKDAERAKVQAEKVQAKIDKLTGVEDSPAPAKKTSKTDKTKKTSSKDKDSKTKVVTQKKRGRPAKAASDEEDD